MDEPAIVDTPSDLEWPTRRGSHELERLAASGHATAGSHSVIVSGARHTRQRRLCPSDDVGRGGILSPRCAWAVTERS